MTVITWTGTVDNDDWDTAANWLPATVPQVGDTALIPPGTSTAPTISADGVKCAMTLGKAESGSVALNVAASFSATPMMIIGNGSTTALDVTLSIQQARTFSGQIRITAPGGTVTITAAPDAGFTFAEKAFVLVAPGSLLNLAAGCFSTAGLFEIAGAVTIASGVTLEGAGLLAIENCGQLAISGIVPQGPQIAFADGTGCITLNDPAAFHGTIGFASVAGGLVMLPGVSVQSMTLEACSDTVSVMTLYGSGGVVATLNVELLDEESLTAIKDPHWGGFAVESAAGSGTTVTYAPQGTPSLQQSLPVTIVADAIAAEPVPLSTIFELAFGTQKPAFYSITLKVPATPAYSETDHRYWRFPNVAAAWLDVDRKPITKATRIDVSDAAAYSLRVGNNIISPAQFVAQVTPSASPAATTVTYTVWTADPKVVRGTSGAAPQAENVVLAAQAMNAKYPKVPNTNLCNWIADCVAAAAGAPMPPAQRPIGPAQQCRRGILAHRLSRRRPDALCRLGRRNPAGRYRPDGVAGPAVSAVWALGALVGPYDDHPAKPDIAHTTEPDVAHHAANVPDGGLRQ